MVSYNINLVSSIFRSTVPGELGNSPKLLKLSSSYNRLSGLIPLELKNPVNKNVFNLQRNNISGSIPSTLQKCQNKALLRTT